jgi:hypothetical protein
LKPATFSKQNIQGNKCSKGCNPVQKYKKNKDFDDKIKVTLNLDSNEKARNEKNWTVNFVQQKPFAPTPNQVGILVDTTEPTFPIYFFNLTEDKQKKTIYSSFPALRVG